MYEFRSNPGHLAAKAETTASPARVRPRRAVAVLGFRNLAGRPDDNWLSTAFTEMLSTELAAGGGLRMVPGEDVARAKRELPLADEDTLAKATLERLRTNPGADVVVLGAYTLLPGKREPGKERNRSAYGWTFAFRTPRVGKPLPKRLSPAAKTNSSNSRRRLGLSCGRAWV